VWEWINQFVSFNNFILTPIANYKGELYSLPFNMWTFHQLWGVYYESQVKKIIEEQSSEITEPSNLEEQAIKLVGKDVYEKLIKGYTEKQWRKPANELPKEIIKRLPVRFTFNNNYFNDKYQGIPIGGYTQIFEKLLKNVRVSLNTDFFEDKEYYESCANKVIYTGPIDKFYDYKFGKLDYRSLYWENELLNTESFQGHPVVNYTDVNTPYTRILEHKFFDNQNQKYTYVSKEYPCEYDGSNEPYYPVRDQINSEIYAQYKNLSDSYEKYIFGGRLGTYAYYDMHQIIAQALKTLEKILWIEDSIQN
jgi:UDP-galactopyranose mutase